MPFLEGDYYLPFFIENVHSQGDSARLVTVYDHSVLMAHAQNDIGKPRTEGLISANENLKRVFANSHI